MPRNYTSEFKQKNSPASFGRRTNDQKHYYGIGISQETLRRWCNEFQQECQAQSTHPLSSVNEAEIMKENLRLRKELAEKEKEILFLKKAAAFFTKEID